MRRREWIIVLGTTAFSATLIFFGLFFLIVGVWSVLSGNGARPAGLEYFVMLFGGSMTAAGTIIVLKLVEAKIRKWITAVRIVSSATLFFVGLLFLIGSFVLGSRIGVMLNPLTLLFGGFGGSMIAAGIIVVFPLDEARKRKWIIGARIASGITLIFVGVFFVTQYELLGMIIGGPMVIAGTITLLRTVR